MKKLIIASITAAVVIMVLAGTLIPILDDATATSDKFTNSGYFTYDAITEDTNTTISWDMTNPDVVTVDNTEIAMPTGTGNWTIVGSENFTLRFYRTTTTGLQCYGSSGFLSSNLSNADTATVTVDVSSMTYTKTLSGTDTSKTYTMGTHGFVINPAGAGALTLKTSEDAAYVLDDSEIYLCGTTFVTGSGTNDFVGVFGYGDVSGVTLSSFYGNTGDNTVSFGTPTINATEVESHVDLYQISSVVFPLTQNDATVTATYSYFVVPTEVTAERSVHFTDGENAIFNAIPVMIIIALLLGVVALVLRSRMD